MQFLLLLLFQSWMDQYFERMLRYSENQELPARIRFMLQDCCELRKNGWVQPRRVTVEKGPQTISQVHQDAAKVCLHITVV